MINNAQKTPFAQSINNFTQRKIDDSLNQLGRAWPCSVSKVSGAIVTVVFEVVSPDGVTLPSVTCPIAESTYVRLPVQVGDYGVVIPANTRLGGITGLGAGLADLVEPTNLGGLVFVPIGNLNWSTVDANAVNVNGPNGVVLRDTDNHCTFTLTPSGTTEVIGSTTITVTGSATTINVNGYTIVVNSTGVTTTVGTSSITVKPAEIDIVATQINLTGSVTVNGTVTGTLDVGSISASGDVVASGISLVTHVHTGVTTGSDDTGPPL